MGRLIRSLFLVTMPMFIGCAQGNKSDDMASGSASDAASDSPDMAMPMEAVPDLAEPIDFAGVTPTKNFGEACLANAQCISGMCLVDKCTVACNQAVPNDCRQVGGFCIALLGSPSPFGCYGTLQTGADLDDSIVQPDGPARAGTLSSLNDADLFQVPLGIGTYSITATPLDGIDVALDAHDTNGAAITTHNDGAVSVAESITLNITTVGTRFFVVRNAGTTTGDYMVTVVKQ